ncbi:hypothetical protein Vadar_022439 [Vaccinium darrowii]|uniref:Uncharacterized protein n=1 Tax=Vaccinium darrowii TaxID=229202 RepID=A0ACB7Y1Q5_9ERIC|nr:hypothetical protein Vadar_022439 [Vaccinium darrowii]
MVTERTQSNLSKCKKRRLLGRGTFRHVYLGFNRNPSKIFSESRLVTMAMWEYPFAVAGVNTTFMLIQMLDLEAGFLFCFLSFILKAVNYGRSNLLEVSFRCSTTVGPVLLSDLGSGKSACDFPLSCGYEFHLSSTYHKGIYHM